MPSGEANVAAMVGEPGACALSQWLSRLRSGPATNGKAIASPSAKRGAVLQCAPRARTQGGALASHKAKRFQKPFGQAKGPVKGFTNRLNLFPTFFTYPLALPSRFCYTSNRQQWAGPSEEARGNPIPLRIERKNE